MPEADGLLPASGAAETIERRTQRGDRVLLLLLCLFCYLPGIAAHDLWAPDEPRYAEVAREMIADGHWLVPHLNGVLYRQKPPLFFWLIAGFGMLLGGVGELAARLPSALAAAAATLLVYDLGRRLFSRRAGWLAAVALATCAKIQWQARTGQIDMVLCLFVVLGVWCWVRSWLGESRYGWGFYLATGLGTLAKGPVALFPPLLSIVVCLLWVRDFKALRALRMGRGLLLWAGVVLAWLVPAVLVTGRQYLDYLLVDQTFNRYLVTEEHPHSFFYYWTQPPVDFFPFVFLLPVALLALLRGPLAVRDERRRRVILLVCWIVVTIVFFSFSPGKRGVYILAIYAPMSLLLGAGLDRLCELAPAATRRRLLWSVVPLAILLLLIPIAVLVASRSQQRYLEVFEPGMLWAGMVSFAPLVIAAVAAVWRVRRGAGEVLLALAAGMALMFPLLGLLVLPRAEPLKSARPLSNLLLRLARPEEPYALYGRPLNSAFVFYTGRYAVDPADAGELLDFLHGVGRRWLLIRRDKLRDVDGVVPGMVRIAGDRDQKRGWELYTTLPAPPVDPASVDPRYVVLEPRPAALGESNAQ